MNGTLLMEERISKQQLQKIYGVNRKTIEDWVHAVYMTQDIGTWQFPNYLLVSFLE